MNEANHSEWKTGLAITTAVLIPALLGHALAPQERLDLGLTCAPFCWRSLFVAHLVASVPLALITAAALARSQLSTHGSASTVCWIMGGLGLTLAVGTRGEFVARACDTWNLDFLARHLARTTIGYLMVLPWLVLAKSAPGSSWRIPASPAALLVAATLALLPTLVYANQMREGRSAEFVTQLETGRLRKAEATLTGLAELSGQRLNDNRTTAQALVDLSKSIAGLERIVEQPLSHNSPSSRRVERAFVLIQLERLDEAASLLRLLAPDSPDACLLLGAVLRDQSRWSESERIYRQLIDSSGKAVVRDPDLGRRLATAYDGMAESARSHARPDVAEQAYQEALRRLPEHTAYMTFQLGRHYLSGGRPSAALTKFHQAVQLDPTLEGRIRPLSDEISVKTPSCLIKALGYKTVPGRMKP